ncbi:4-aminobutyrate aminotransferase [Cokeromyces recurvatus]|uniref:4-aminobutyrate aminotransferase n=1 Tax=Cokeromyces recurvatus TaxID=90255 RepID=UPI00221FDE9D|nr:4-aminobutyrate aminotransferase [Cokeromyces recurvatus]KAI7907629.1 4-aminobutyrate aminotransferase [Cokeromyces recurvatus]
MVSGLFYQTVKSQYSRAAISRPRYISTLTNTSFFSDEPSRPHVITPIPGPKSKEIISKLNQYQDTRSIFFIADFSKSKGNYIVDADGNTLLDVFAQIASIPIGYNNPVFSTLSQDPAFQIALSNRAALGVSPNKDWIESIEKAFMTVAPRGMTNVFTVMCGSCANENAFKTAFMYKAAKRRGDREFSLQELSSCMKNEAPGSANDLSILSFTQAFHGRLLGSLTATASKAIHKIDIPAFDWPKATFPQLKYPLQDHVEENSRIEEESLKEVEELIVNAKKPVAAVIVEPIQAEGGDNHASPNFFRKLQEICQKNDVLLIVDEVQTGVGATGTFWAHEAWHLPDPPDIVTFSKKFQAAGFYLNPRLRPSQPYRLYNTWMGDPVRAMQAATIVQEIKDKNLLQNVRDVGHYLQQNLLELQQQQQQAMTATTSIITHVRGQGMFIAFDLPDSSQRDSFLLNMRQRGIHMGGCGEQTVRLRPMLTFQKQHADILLNTMAQLLR